MAESEAPNVIATNGEAPGGTVEASASVASVPDVTDKSKLSRRFLLSSKSIQKTSLVRKRSRWIDEGKEVIRRHQKLIQIADKSIDGWNVEDEYLSDELASDSADEKQLKTARDIASRKRKQNLQEKDLPPTEKCFFMVSKRIIELSRINDRCNLLGLI
jgi:hypothetical protein